MSIRVNQSALFSLGEYLLLMQYIDFLPMRACHLRRQMLECMNGKPDVTLCASKRVILFGGCHIRGAGYVSVSLYLSQDPNQHSVEEGLRTT